MNTAVTCGNVIGRACFCKRHATCAGDDPGWRSSARSTSNASSSASAVAAFAAPSWANLIPITKMLLTPSMPLRTHTNLWIMKLEETMAANSPKLAARLPSELVALIHHVELSEAGWRDELLDRLVLSSLYLHGTPLSLDELRSGLESDFGLATEDSTCHQSVERLLASDRLVGVADGRLRLAHQATVEAEKAIAENQALEERVAERFKVIVAEESSKVDPEDAWCRFRDKCLDPLVKELGARTYDLISSPEGKGADVQSVAAYTDSYALDVQESIKRTMDRFLDPADIDVRSFVLSRLHSHFLTLAASLSKRSLLELTKKRKSNL